MTILPLLTSLFLLPAPGQAQVPVPIDLSAAANSTVIVRWAVDEVASVRFLGEAEKGPVISRGDRVDVIFEDEAAGMVRVRHGAAYGWVPAAKLTDQDPEAAPAEDG